MALKQTAATRLLRTADPALACRLTPQLPILRPPIQSQCSTSCTVPSSSLRHQQADLQPRGAMQACRATDQDKQQNSWSMLPSRFNPAYAAIVGGYAALFALKNPYIFAALSIATIIPQNSTTTSLNSLVILFYESGLFMNFAEAVYCVRLVTWLSILCCLASFSLFN